MPLIRYIDNVTANITVISDITTVKFNVALLHGLSHDSIFTDEFEKNIPKQEISI